MTFVLPHTYRPTLTVFLYIYGEREGVRYLLCWHLKIFWHFDPCVWSGRSGACINRRVIHSWKLYTRTCLIFITMDHPKVVRQCGCKGCRTCLLCEKEFGIEKPNLLNVFQVSEWTFAYSFCTRSKSNFHLPKLSSLESGLFRLLLLV